jgi:hypothetical protein
VAAVLALAAGALLASWQSEIRPRPGEERYLHLLRKHGIELGRREAGTTARALVARTADLREWGVFWLALPLVLVAGRRGLRRRPAIALAVAAAVPLGIGLAAYAVAPWKGGVLVRGTWNRMLLQSLLPLTVLEAMALEPILRRRRPVAGGGPGGRELVAAEPSDIVAPVEVPMTNPHPAGGDPADAEPRVEEVLQRLRSGVRQRRAEATTAGGLGEEARLRLLDLRGREFVREPVPFSHRRGLGGAIVAVRKAVYHLFLRWFTRPVLEQQNAFNQAASGLVQELVEGQEKAARQLQDLGSRLADLERRAGDREAAERRDGERPAGG